MLKVQSFRRSFCRSTDSLPGPYTSTQSLLVELRSDAVSRLLWLLPKPATRGSRYSTRSDPLERRGPISFPCPVRLKGTARPSFAPVRPENNVRQRSSAWETRREGGRGHRGRVAISRSGTESPWRSGSNTAWDSMFLSTTDHNVFPGEGKESTRRERGTEERTNTTRLIEAQRKDRGRSWLHEASREELLTATRMDFPTRRTTGAGWVTSCRPHWMYITDSRMTFLHSTWPLTADRATAL
ncbi:hypothetical protein EYF80_059669 [Liparis tanakae]|uniref:Uncharacterized protein n=1 Tax=Liparis tanakae TaxID=230148 RepID=A0A4Z2ENL0_9TELE|nr:hypothetical protein EYF80_059669 [Liparis tanakae]